MVPEMPRGTTITIPDEVDLAIRAEAYRVGCRPAEILVRWLRATFPDYIRGELDSDLNNRLAESRRLHATTPPAATEGASNLKSPQTQANDIIPPEASRGNHQVPRHSGHAESQACDSEEDQTGGRRPG